MIPPAPSTGAAVDDGWLEVAIDAPAEAEEAVAAALHAAGSAGAWVVDGTVRGYWAPGAADPAGAFAAAWRETTGTDWGGPPVEIRRVPDADWTEGWRERVRPERVGERLWVAPPEAEPEGGWPEGALVVRILPGLGFGTGSHPTTRALLRWLEAEPGASVLDVGTGSGVLAIAAALLGATGAVGLDVDPMALENATGNVRRNGAGGRVRLVRGTVEAVRDEPRFDRVLANLDAPTLAAILSDLARRCAAGGRVGISGVLAGERGAAIARARAAGLRLVDEAVAADDAGGEEWWSGWLAREAA